jgi:hypothetical protein
MDTDPDSERVKWRRIWMGIPDSDYVQGSRKGDIDTTRIPKRVNVSGFGFRSRIQKELNGYGSGFRIRIP